MSAEVLPGGDAAALREPLRGPHPQAPGWRVRRLGAILGGGVLLVVLGGGALLAVPGQAAAQTASPAATPAATPAAASAVDEAIELTRNQFAGLAARPEQTLAGELPVTVGPERWRIAGAEVLRVSSPDPEVAAVLRYEPLAFPVGDGTDPLRLIVIVIARDGVQRYAYKRDGQLLRQGELVPQRAFRVGEHGLVTALAGRPGRVREIVIQDDGDAELRLAQAGGVLELQVVPPAQGGSASGGGRPYYLGRRLRYVDGSLLVAAYTGTALGALRVGDLLALRVNVLAPAGGEAVLARGLVTAQAWRSERVALEVEGGAGYSRVKDAGTTTSELRIAGGVTLHWRRGPWGAAGHLGLVGETSVLELAGAWQGWEHVGLVLAWQSFATGSGLGLGAAVGF